MDKWKYTFQNEIIHLKLGVDAKTRESDLRYGHVQMRVINAPA